MILKNVKAIECLGIRYEVAYPADGDEMAAFDGKIETSWQKLSIRKNLPEQRKSHTIWHEIVHHICHYARVLDSGKGLSESEIDRFATALNDLEIITDPKAK